MSAAPKTIAPNREALPWLRPAKRLSLASTKAYWASLLASGLVSEAEQSELLDARAEADLPRYQRNIENYVGTVKVPVGVIGPLRILGRAARGDFYVPLATTEAALVASYGRGAGLISQAGGCETLVADEAVHRTPVFGFASLAEADAFARWVAARFDQLKAIADATTAHGKLTRIVPSLEGDHVYLVCSFTTADAAGQNMVTFATNALCAFIVDASPIHPARWFLEANLSGDKKATAAALCGVRGRKAIASIEIADADIRRCLHTSAERMADLWRASSIGAVMSGAVGLQAHYANGLAALYLATGQDVACVAESAVGVTRMEVREHGRLYASVTLPNIMVGTVGGGTQLPSQAAGLSILGLKGAGCAGALAEVCAALCLAGELSLGGALCAGHFAQAHHRLARRAP
jgi:hydroxymethylglutaryl-CoA reductase (NADPH)